MTETVVTPARSLPRLRSMSRHRPSGAALGATSLVLRSEPGMGKGKQCDEPRQHRRRHDVTGQGKDVRGEHAEACGPGVLRAGPRSPNAVPSGDADTRIPGGTAFE